MKILIAEDNDYFISKMAQQLALHDFTAPNYRPDMKEREVARTCLTETIQFIRGDDQVTMVAITRDIGRAIDSQQFDIGFFDNTLYGDKSTYHLAAFLDQPHQPGVYLISNDTSEQLRLLQDMIGAEKIAGYKASGRLIEVETKDARRNVMPIIAEKCPAPVKPAAAGGPEKPFTPS